MLEMQPQPLPHQSQMHQQHQQLTSSRPTPEQQQLLDQQQQLQYQLQQEYAIRQQLQQQQQQNEMQQQQQMQQNDMQQMQYQQTPPQQYSQQQLLLLQQHQQQQQNQQNQQLPLSNISQFTPQHQQQFLSSAENELMQQQIRSQMAMNQSVIQQQQQLMQQQTPPYIQRDYNSNHEENGYPSVSPSQSAMSGSGASVSTPFPQSTSESPPYGDQRTPTPNPSTYAPSPIVLPVGYPNSVDVITAQQAFLSPMPQPLSGSNSMAEIGGLRPMVGMGIGNMNTLLSGVSPPPIMSTTTPNMNMNTNAMLIDRAMEGTQTHQQQNGKSLLNNVEESKNGIYHHPQKQHIPLGSNNRRKSALKAQAQMEEKKVNASQEEDDTMDVDEEAESEQNMADSEAEDSDNEEEEEDDDDDDEEYDEDTKTSRPTKRQAIANHGGGTPRSRNKPVVSSAIPHSSSSDPSSMTVPVVLNAQGKPKRLKGSSCHQCKIRRSHAELCHCGMAHVRKPVVGSRARKRKKERRCRKQYCPRCLDKFYGEEAPPFVPPGELNTWACPGCRGICTCAACKRGLSKKDPNGPEVTLVPQPALPWPEASAMPKQQIGSKKEDDDGDDEEDDDDSSNNSSQKPRKKSSPPKKHSPPTKSKLPSSKPSMAKSHSTNSAHSKVSSSNRSGGSSSKDSTPSRKKSSAASSKKKSERSKRAPPSSASSSASSSQPQNRHKPQYIKPVLARAVPHQPLDSKPTSANTQLASHISTPSTPSSTLATRRSPRVANRAIERIHMMHQRQQSGNSESANTCSLSSAVTSTAGDTEEIPSYDSNVNTTGGGQEEHESGMSTNTTANVSPHLSHLENASASAVSASSSRGGEEGGEEDHNHQAHQEDEFANALETTPSFTASRFLSPDQRQSQIQQHPQHHNMQQHHQLQQHPQNHHHRSAPGSGSGGSSKQMLPPAVSSGDQSHLQHHNSLLTKHSSVSPHISYSTLPSFFGDTLLTPPQSFNSLVSQPTSPLGMSTRRSPRGMNATLMQAGISTAGSRRQSIGMGTMELPELL